MCLLSWCNSSFFVLRITFTVISSSKLAEITLPDLRVWLLRVSTLDLLTYVPTANPKHFQDFIKFSSAFFGHPQPLTLRWCTEFIKPLTNSWFASLRATVTFIKPRFGRVLKNNYNLIPKLIWHLHILYLWTLSGFSIHSISLSKNNFAEQLFYFLNICEFYTK